MLPPRGMLNIFLLWSPSCAFPAHVCILVLFQDLGAPARKRKASTSLTDDEGLSPGPFAIPSAVLELSSGGRPLGAAMTSRTAMSRDHWGPCGLCALVEGGLFLEDLRCWPAELGECGTEHVHVCVREGRQRVTREGAGGG